MKTTKIKELRTLAKTFLYLEPTPCEIPFIIIHPYFDSVMQGTYNENKELELVDIREPENLQKVQSNIEKMIENADLSTLIGMIRPPYHFAFLKYGKPYISKKEFDEYLAYMWVNCENPNQDANLSLKDAVKWFKAADKHTIMSDEEYEYYSKLPDEVEIYRGIGVGRAEKEGLSWTDKRKTAHWFAHRFDCGDDKGYILKAKIKKSDILAYFNGRNEDELLCDSSKIYNVLREQE